MTWYTGRGCRPLLPFPGDSSLVSPTQVSFTGLVPPGTLCLTPGPGECPLGPLLGWLRGVAGLESRWLRASQVLLPPMVLLLREEALHGAALTTPKSLVSAPPPPRRPNVPGSSSGVEALLCWGSLGTQPQIGKETTHHSHPCTFPGVKTKALSPKAAWNCHGVLDTLKQNKQNPLWSC